MDADEVIINLERISERRIREAIDAGEFDNLRGMGQPLKLDDNPFVPEDMRAAFTVLANSGYAPDWMVLGQEIDADLAQLRAIADQHFAYLRERLAELASDPYAVKRLRQELQKLRAHHARVSAQYSSAIGEINRKVRVFNETVPIASLLKVPLSERIEMERFEDRVPAYLSYGG